MSITTSRILEIDPDRDDESKSLHPAILLFWSGMLAQRIVEYGNDKCKSMSWNPRDEDELIEATRQFMEYIDTQFPVFHGVVEDMYAVTMSITNLTPYPLGYEYWNRYPINGKEYPLEGVIISMMSLSDYGTTNPTSLTVASFDVENPAMVTIDDFGADPFMPFTEIYQIMRDLCDEWGKAGDGFVYERKEKGINPNLEPLKWSDVRGLLEYVAMDTGITFLDVAMDGWDYTQDADMWSQEYFDTLKKEWRGGSDLYDNSWAFLHCAKAEGDLYPFRQLFSVAAVLRYTEALDDYIREDLERSTQ